MGKTLQKISKSTGSSSLFTRVQESDLVVLRTTRDEVSEAVAIAREKESIFNRLLIQAVRKVGQPVEGRALCLDCGVIYLQGSEHSCRPT